MGQDLKQHRWENRIIIIQTPNDSVPLYRSQLSEFANSIKEFKERKIVLYEVIGDKIKMTDYLSDEPKALLIKSEPSSNLLKEHKNQFKVLLVGLDGGIKYETNDLFIKSELIKLIDAMPMRRSEIRKVH